ncbi:MAG: group II intron reverse transcriptase/maturase [Candidatus Lindowbacteria bacterium]|nr:group II intron reverse transcriptase/maturase [Candidatus Lindowbacteria bacterium]
MEEVTERENLKAALARVKRNKGGPGIDGVTVDEISGYLKEHWLAIRNQLFDGTYKPQAVKRVEIPKAGGGVRKLGIPTVLDRFIQQAVLQVLQERWDRTFSESSFGFRPKRSAHQAVAQAQKYMAEGRRYVVDIDLEKFFDRVNHDRMMGRIAQRVKDKRVLKLLRAFLNAGVMENGLVSRSEQGTPQGGPLSPLLSNLVLDELDRELERRGHCFVRYADDSNIYVHSERAGHRVMKSVTRFIEDKLKLKVNSTKSAVGRSHLRKFLGFCFTSSRKEPRRRISPEALKRFKWQIRKFTRRSHGRSTRQMIRKMTNYLRGWGNYYGFCQTPSVLQGLDFWIRRRIRCNVWKQWPRSRARLKGLRRLGLEDELAINMSKTNLGHWRCSNMMPVRFAVSPKYLKSLGLPSLIDSVKS